MGLFVTITTSTASSAVHNFDIFPFESVLWPRVEPGRLSMIVLYESGLDSAAAVTSTRLLLAQRNEMGGMDFGVAVCLGNLGNAGNLFRRRSLDADYMTARR